jgi:predicted phosphodiesterase
MRYALISDIHSNLQALDAVLADIDAHGITAIYHLGDLTGYSSNPNEVVSRLRERGIPGVSGNYDSTVATDYKHCGCRSENPRQEELSHLSYEWTRAHVSPETKTFLGALPFRIDLKPLGGHVSGPTVTLVHATPINNLVYVTEDRSDAFLAKMAKQAGLESGDAICFGHTHKPWRRVVDGVHFINTGSVGRPKDGDYRASYVLLDATDAIKGEIVRVDYDVEVAAKGVIDSGLPEEFAEFLRTGGGTPEPASS